MKHTNHIIETQPTSKEQQSLGHEDSLQIIKPLISLILKETIKTIIEKENIIRFNTTSKESSFSCLLLTKKFCDNIMVNELISHQDEFNRVTFLETEPVD